MVSPPSISSLPNDGNLDATIEKTNIMIRDKSERSVSFNLKNDHTNGYVENDSDDDDTSITIYREDEERPLLDHVTPTRSNAGEIVRPRDYESVHNDHRYPVIYNTTYPQEEVDVDTNTMFTFFTSNQEQKRHQTQIRTRQQLSEQQERLQFRRKMPTERSGKDIWETLRTKVLSGKFVTELPSSSHSLSSLMANVIKYPQHKEQQQQQKQPPNHNHTLIECALYLLLYLLISVLAYSYLLDTWPVVDSLYFTVVTLTTVGYGDVTPDTWQGRLFTCFFALTGVAILGMVLGEVGSRMVESHVKAVEGARATAAERLFNVRRKLVGGSHSRRLGEEEGILKGDSISEGFSESFDDGSCVEDDESIGTNISSRSTLVFSHSRQRMRKMRRAENRKKQRGQKIASTACYAWSEMCRVFGRYLPAFVPLIVGSLFMAHSEDWSYIDAIYYCIVTTTTIGFGDLHPTLNRSKLFAVPFIPLSVGAMGHILATVANDILERRRESHQAFILEQEQLRPLTINDLKIMNDKGEGNVSELEYVTFMLVRMGIADWETIDELQERFKKWDVRGDGIVNEDDLQIVARRKKRSVRSKLKLEEYKRRLVQQCDSVRGSSLCDIKDDDISYDDDINDRKQNDEIEMDMTYDDDINNRKKNEGGGMT